MIADVFAVASHWRRWDNKLLLLLMPGAILGMLLGTLFIATISPGALKRGIGVILLLFVIYKLLESRWANASHYLSSGMKRPPAPRATCAPVNAGIEAWYSALASASAAASHTPSLSSFSAR